MSKYHRISLSKRESIYSLLKQKLILIQIVKLLSHHKSSLTEKLQDKKFLLRFPNRAEAHMRSNLQGIMSYFKWICEHLCPLLDEGYYIIMNNASIHKDIKIKDAIEKAGCTLLYLPIYSLNLNPIEHCWANFKKFDTFKEAITVASSKTFLC